VPGMGEWLVILIIVLLVFGANKLPSIGDALGRSIKNFKRASGGADDEADEEPAPKKSKAKQVEGKAAKQIEDNKAGEAEAGDDDEWEEVVVRRKKKKSAASAEEG